MNQNSKLRDRIRDTTIEAILEAAEVVFAEAGVHAAKVEAIAAQAGVSVGTIYNHLGDRESVLTALVNARRSEMLQLLDDTLKSEAGKPFSHQIKTFLSAIVGHFEAHSKFFSILIQGEHAKESKLLAISPAMREIYDRVVQLMQRGEEQKVLCLDLMDLYPVLFMGMVRSVFVRSLFEPKLPCATGTRVEQLARFFMHGAGIKHG
jgi:AcrR family transcriptional regulator